MENKLPKLLRQNLSAFAGAKRFVVAYSGGMDSHALLHALRSLNLPQKIQALHINHGLSAQADQWQAHCEAACKTLGADFSADMVKVEPNGSGLEDAARQARYRVFAAHIQAGDVLLLAHHADDQLETFFLRLMRGAGVRGLGGMPAQRAIGGGTLLRPWLEASRDTIHLYAQKHALRWIEDESNHGVKFDRNYLRLQVLPLLQKRWPKADENIARSMSWCREADAVMDELAQMDYLVCHSRTEFFGFSLVTTTLRELSLARRRNVLRLWLARCAAPAPNLHTLDAMLEQGINARADAMPRQNWRGWQCRRYRERLYVFPALPPFDKGAVWQCTVGDHLQAAGFGELSFTAAQGQGMRVDSSRPLTIRFAREGVRCRPLGRAHSQTLKKLFQEAAVPPWLRERTPLIYQGDQLLAVGNKWICADAAASPSETGFMPNWQMTSSQ